MDKKDSLDFIVIIILILIIDRNMICVSFCIAYQECTPNIDSFLISLRDSYD